MSINLTWQKKAQAEFEPAFDPTTLKEPARSPFVLAGRRLVPFILPAVTLLSWQIACRSGFVAPQILPSPAAVYLAAEHLAHTELWADVLISTKRALLGFAIGGSIGLVCGMFNGLIRAFEEIFDTSIHLTRTIPHLALIPLLILWFGIGEETKVILVAMGVFFPIYLNTFHGMRSVDPGLVEAGRVYGLRGFSLFRQVILPAALPSILVGLRFALGAMWLTLIVAETIAADSGIGYITTNAREFMQTDVMLVGILLYALLGKGADLFSRSLERILLPWHPNYGQAAK